MVNSDVTFTQTLLFERIGDLNEGIPLLPGLSALDSPSCSPHALLPSAAAGPNFTQDLSIVTRAHFTSVTITDTGYHKKSSSVDQHKLYDWVVVWELIVENLLQDLGILSRLLSWGHGVEGMSRHAKVLGHQLEMLNLDFSRRGILFKLPAQRRPGAADLVELLLAADDHGLAHTIKTQALGKDRAEILPRDTNDAGFDHGAVMDVHGIGQGPQQVENGAPGKLLAHRRDKAHAWVEGGREQEGVVGVGVDLADLVGLDGGHVGRGGEGHVGDEVGRAGFGGRGTVAVLGDEEERGGEDGGGGADVEGVMGIATCSNNVALGGESNKVSNCDAREREIR